MLVVVNLQLLIREQNSVIAKAYHDGNFMIRKTQIEWDKLVEELEIWTKLKNVSLMRPWLIAKHNVIQVKDADLYTDASSSQMGSALQLFPDKGQFENRIFRYTLNESHQSIHVKECLAILRALQSHVTELENCRVMVHCDNQAVVHAWRKLGCRDMRVNRILLKIFELCWERNIRLQFCFDFISKFRVLRIFQGPLVTRMSINKFYLHN